MNWQAIAAVAELLSAIGVVLSLLYLAAQVRTSTRQARLDASRELAVRITEASLAAATTRDLAELFHQGAGDLLSLDPVDQTRFRGFMNSLFRGFEQQFLLRSEGALDDEMWASVTAIIGDFVSLPGAQTYLRDRRAWYVPSFIQLIEQISGVDLSEGTRMADHYRPSPAHLRDSADLDQEAPEANA
jgi:hypothetical protein